MRELALVGVFPDLVESLVQRPLAHDRATCQVCSWCQLFLTWLAGHASLRERARARAGRRTEHEAKRRSCPLEEHVVCRIAEAHH